MFCYLEILETQILLIARINLGSLVLLWKYLQIIWNMVKMFVTAKTMISWNGFEPYKIMRCCLSQNLLISILINNALRENDNWARLWLKHSFPTSNNSSTLLSVKYINILETVLKGNENRKPGTSKLDIVLLEIRLLWYHDKPFSSCYTKDTICFTSAVLPS